MQQPFFMETIDPTTFVSSPSGEERTPRLCRDKTMIEWLFFFSFLRGGERWPREWPDRGLSPLLTYRSTITSKFKIYYFLATPFLYFPLIGKVTVKVLPVSGMLVTVTLPPKASDNSFTMVNPNPKPPLSRLRDLSVR